MIRCTPGYGGNAVKVVAVEFVRQVGREKRIGVGQIETWIDVLVKALRYRKGIRRTKSRKLKGVIILRCAHSWSQIHCSLPALILASEAESVGQERTDLGIMNGTRALSSPLEFYLFKSMLHLDWHSMKHE